MDPLACSTIAVFAERVVTFGSGRRSRAFFSDFCWTASYESLNFETSLGPQPSKNRLKGIVFRVRLPRKQKQKKRRAKTSPAFSLDVFRTFFPTALCETLTFDNISKNPRVFENTPQGS